jgi:amino acid transporter/nucleotide-binding universal stress UspA family protein
VELSLNEHRPRNVGWARAASFLYGDWGTSKAYVTGLAFVAAGFSSLPIILAVCALTGLVGINYAVVCKHFPDGGGVYSAARLQGRLLAVIGALLLIADMTVTAALSGWDALSYFKIPILTAHPAFIPYATIFVLLLMGAINWYGPKHSGTFAVALSLPTVIVVLVLIGISVPHLTTHYLEPLHQNLGHVWVQFTGVILALSGVEAIANLTGVLKLDPGSTPDHPKVGREATKAIFPVAIEVVVGTALLGWAMLSVPAVLSRTLHLTNHVQIVDLMRSRKDDMLRFIAEQYGTATVSPAFGQLFGWIVGIVFFLLLISAANTAVAAMVGLMYMMARDGEMPVQFKKLNSHGVPLIPLLVAIGLPSIVLLASSDFEGLSGLYAIGVVGAITVNLGCCCFNRTLDFKFHDRILFGFTFAVLSAVEITLAKTKPDALFFVLCVLGVGLGVRAFTQKKQGLTTLTLTREVANMVDPEKVAALRAEIKEGQRIMVAARGITPVLRYALEEARLRKASLCVLYVKEIAILLSPTGGSVTKRMKWQEDPEAAAIMSLVIRIGEEQGVPVMPVFVVSDAPANTILDLAATMGIDFLMLGASHRMTLQRILKGSVVETVAAGLPEDIQLIIHG